MSATPPKDIQRWEETRQRGKWNYVFLNGMLAWGVPMFVVMTFFVNKRADRPLTAGLIALSAVLWATGGFCFGFVTWTIFEKRYKKYLAAQGIPPKL